MAEREGFEPPVPLPAHLISSQAHSATLPSLHVPKKVEDEERVWQAKGKLWKPNTDKTVIFLVG